MATVQDDSSIPEADDTITCTECIESSFNKIIAGKSSMTEKEMGIQTQRHLGPKSMTREPLYGLLHNQNNKNKKKISSI